MARVVQVIEAVEPRGRGKDESDPIRPVYRYYAFDGTFLAENDLFDFGMFERWRLREAVLALLSRVDAVVITDAVGNRFHKVFEKDLDALQALIEGKADG